eukprot:TRINITY_DN17087_c0_g1_i3.p1 TRINITY_DN17087_c0_g1~~TRINITY_DN17087_c0_g1_i3.p1  ORF type:complete len:189 (+),score=50.72 TRINITY_DN17087_c0_g1_i3:57-623(+)
MGQTQCLPCGARSGAAAVAPTKASKRDRLGDGKASKFRTSQEAEAGASPPLALQVPQRTAERAERPTVAAHAWAANPEAASTVAVPANEGEDAVRDRGLVGALVMQAAHSAATALNEQYHLKEQAAELGKQAVQAGVALNEKYHLTDQVANVGTQALQLGKQAATQARRTMYAAERGGGIERAVPSRR